MQPTVAETRQLHDALDAAAAELVLDPDAPSEPDALLAAWGVLALKRLDRAVLLTLSPHAGDRSETVTVPGAGGSVTAPVGELVGLLGLVSATRYHMPECLPAEALQRELRALAPGD